MNLFKKKKSGAGLQTAVNQKTLHKNLDFTATEQYKLLRANLQFTLPQDEKCPIIGVTSAMRGEGKSTTAVNLSYVLAEKGNRVLLIDGDLRIPSIAKKMKIANTPGLTDLLIGNGAQMAEFQSSLHKNWYILPSGDIPPNPSELLGSHRMESVLCALRENFDYIVIDLPPVNIVSDALSIASLITGMIVVISEGYTEKKELEQCMRQLKLSSTKILGFVMNETGSNKNYSKYGGKYKKYYKKYYKSGYGAGTAAEEKKA